MWRFLLLAMLCLYPLGAVPLDAADAPQELVVVSWNVLADASERERRLPVLLTTLRDARPDVIAVQEATTWFSSALAAEPWAKDLRRVPVEADHAFPGGLAVFTRLSVVGALVVEIPSDMSRCGLLVELSLGSSSLAVGVVHLDSHLEDGPVRSQQLQAMGRAFAGQQHAVLLGDFNFGDGEPEGRDVPPGFVDVWSVLHPGKPGFTWDIARSPMARRGSFPDEPSRRLDRVLVRSPTWRPTAMSLFGTDPVPDTKGEVFPSDHFGVRVVLTKE